jgi:hypothetical protein
MKDRPMTLGKDRVRLSFNPSNDSAVDQVKLKTAELIDLVNEMPDNDPAGKMTSETKRLKALAMTHYEIASMFAVKALTVFK